MTTTEIILFSLGVLCHLITWILTLVIIVKAFKESILWGLGSLLIPLIILIYIIKFWSDTKKAFLICILFSIPTYFMGDLNVKAAIEVAKRFSPESVPEIEKIFGVTASIPTEDPEPEPEPEIAAENLHGIFAGPIKVPAPNGFSRAHLQDIGKDYSVRYMRALEGEEYSEFHFMNFDHSTSLETWETIADTVLSNAEEEPKIVNGWSIHYMSAHPFKKVLKGHHYYSLYSSADFSFMSHMSAPSHISKDGLEGLLVNYLDEHIKPQIKFEEYTPSKK